MSTRSPPGAASPTRRLRAWLRIATRLKPKNAIAATVANSSPSRLSRAMLLSARSSSMGRQTFRSTIRRIVMNPTA